MKSQWEKFKHRTLTKVFLGYAVVAWVLIQVIEAVLPTFETPLWVAQTITFLLILGFPIAIIVGWASEKLPTLSGLPPSTSAAPQPVHATPTKNLIWIGFGSCIVVGLFGFYMMPFIFDSSEFQQRSTPRIISPNGPGTANVLKAQIDIGISRQKANGLKSEIALSPDGATLIYRVARPEERGSQYYARNLQSYSEPLGLQRSGLNTGRGAVENRSGFPSFRNGNDWIYYYTDRGSKLNRVRVEGGTAQIIQEGPLLLNSFTVRENILFFGTQDGMILRKVIGSESTELIYEVENDGERAIWLEFIENTDYLMATILPVVFSEQEPKVILIDVKTGSSEIIIEQGYQSKYARSGHITYLQADALWAVPFSVSDMTIQGSQVPVINGIETTISRDVYFGNYNFSENGRLVYISGNLMRRGSGNFNVLDIELTRLNHSGDTRKVNVPESSFAEITVSPDQNLVAMTRLDESGSRDVWVWDLVRESLGRRSFGGVDGTPIWSNDGKSIFYQSEQNATAEIWRTASNGSSSAEFITSTPFPRIDLETISPSGDLIVYSENTPTGGIYTFDLSNVNRENVHEPLITPPGFRINLSRISPDGNWIAYLSNETGERQLYVQSFPNIAQGKYQITSGRNVSSFEWHPDGDKIYFTRQEFDGQLESRGSTQIFQAEIEYGPLLETGRPEFLIASRPELLVESSKPINGNQPNFDVLSATEFIFTNDSDDGVRILESQVIVNVVENWFDELATLVPFDNLQ